MHYATVHCATVHCSTAFVNANFPFSIVRGGSSFPDYQKATKIRRMKLQAIRREPYSILSLLMFIFKLLILSLLIFTRTYILLHTLLFAV